VLDGAMSYRPYADSPESGGHEFLWRSHKIKSMVVVEPDSLVKAPELLGRTR